MIDFERDPIRPELWENQLETLYHYCSASTFELIASRKTVRLSDLAQSNDSAEGEWYWSVLRSVVGESVPRWIEETRDHHAAQAKATLGLCLTEEDDLLSQWRGYADDGRGVCIGFSAAALFSIAEEIGEGKPRLYRVEYSEDDQRRVAEWVNERQRFRKPTDHIIENSDYFQFAFKNNGFREEKEWRLMAIKPLAKCKYVARADRFVPVLDLPLNPAAIVSVRLGPRNNTPPEVMRGMLASYGFPETTVGSATATYR
ncbi:DUF2971 domain-containing protein [Rhizobium laguerreae]|uniref:DUF2971 domain-containing protein n=1 Tax=Rhizobium laguerreae TaxID=1076926 RepID=UPI001C925670|nr:DUF2971 domain-containing protein [Rhizobium laguerreae]MBY3342693.1 DUF2971 domain-containing protein [Rhizobium laguerreae]MBY3349728.1 DUF2971 domain-containing protein [Rhizobium laguerreae]MBY3370831.1 DUF2971 domain-containing protein [Rhizobium laguerreae]MBY3426071.1 DUF2971 domain-containing protein [Rhizobium laguerreae]MBY3434378.1 DUF2971 domain-containing protein [Rhizobium laguerreae]